MTASARPCGRGSASPGSHARLQWGRMGKHRPGRGWGWGAGQVKTAATTRLPSLTPGAGLGVGLGRNLQAGPRSATCCLGPARGVDTGTPRELPPRTSRHTTLVLCGRQEPMGEAGPAAWGGPGGCPEEEMTRAFSSTHPRQAGAPAAPVRGGYESPALTGPPSAPKEGTAPHCVHLRQQELGSSRQ